MARALLLDVGGVVIRTPFELLDLAERRHGLSPGALGPRGPFGLADDPAFVEVLSGQLAERAYWAERADRGARLLGTLPDTRSFMQALFDLPEDAVVRPEARALVREARAAGLLVGVLTNDLVDFHGRDWVGRMTIFDAVDVMVDGSVTGVLKPDPGAYRLALDALGVAPGEVVFLDDQPVNIRGALEVGLDTIAVDVSVPGLAVDEARDRLGLPPGSGAARRAG